MKITKSRLKQIIQEEIQNVLEEMTKNGNVKQEPATDSIAEQEAKEESK